MKNVRPVALITAAVSIIGGVAGCGSEEDGSGSSSAGQSPSAARSPIAFGVFEVPDPLFSGIEDGSFDNVDYELVTIESGPQALSLVKGGTLDALDVGSTPIVIAAATGVEMKVVWSPFYSKSRLVVKEASTAEDLHGKTIATVGGSIADYHLTEYLEANGIDDAKLVDMPGGSMPAALKTGQIDGAYIWDPIDTALLEEPGASALDEQNTGAYIMVTDELIEDDPEAVQELVCGFASAADSFISDPAAAHSAIADRLKLDAAAVAEMLPAEQVYDAEDQATQLGPDAVDLTVGIGEWLVKNDRVESAPSEQELAGRFDLSFAETALDGGCN